MKWLRYRSDRRRSAAEKKFAPGGTLDSSNQLGGKKRIISSLAFPLLLLEPQNVGPQASLLADFSADPGPFEYGSGNKCSNSVFSF